MKNVSSQVNPSYEMEASARAISLFSVLPFPAVTFRTVEGFSFRKTSQNVVSVCNCVMDVFVDVPHPQQHDSLVGFLLFFYLMDARFASAFVRSCDGRASSQTG